ncbi:hypothetical protein BDD43_0019 [Mucilaginibacter gracilis]|uniref:Lysophospholipase L1-like esterase n=1 Tax=Mucilaginibacter gracilis TaxID=423350 RepID=A0A495ITR5_9SPHI|nr:SGNH/GDSL hydrolase family protein [Mucilaginibacter gracilis]RKR79933.1 hypothetical protein BDD43_0019 [Mucilaginibacter gracilis]
MYRYCKYSCSIIALALSACSGLKNTRQANIFNRQDAIAASQAGASPLFFEAGLLPEGQQVSGYSNDKELISRNGLPNFFNKVNAGKPLTIAFIGGSVTQMDNKYRNQTAKYIRALYPKSAIRFMNAGVSGSGTDLGACRIQNQVLNYKPDLLFVEFAVNGSYLPGLEGIIREVIKNDPGTDICLLYAIMSGQSQLYMKGEEPANILELETLADHYHLPAIHLGWEPSALEAQGKLIFKPDPKVTDKPVFSDGIHPTEFGGYIYAGAIVRSLNKMQSVGSAKKHVLPAPMIKDNWEDGKMLGLEQLTFSSGWEKIDPKTNANLKQFAPWFSYVMQADRPGSFFSFSFKGNKIGVFDIGGPEVGQLDLVVDGKKLKSLNRFSHWCNNRYRGQYDFVDVPYGEHQVQLVISSEIPDKKALLGTNQLADITANPDKYNKCVIWLGKVLIRGELIKNIN